jgi:hypothetical protein
MKMNSKKLETIIAIGLILMVVGCFMLISHPVIFVIGATMASVGYMIFIWNI